MANKLKLLRSKIKAYKWLITNRFKVLAWRKDGKKYLAVLETNWRGTKWRRTFEVVDELDQYMNPIPFPGKDAVKPCTKQ